MFKMNEQEYEAVDKIIQSAIDRTVHSAALQDIVESAVNKAVPPAIEKNVNGGIRALHARMSKQEEWATGHDKVENEFQKDTRKQWEEIAPIVQAFKEEKAFNEGAQKIGNKAIKWAQIVAAIGILLVALRLGVLQLINYKP